MKRYTGCAVLLVALMVNIVVAHQLRQNREAIAAEPTVAAREVPFASAQLCGIPADWTCIQCISQRTYALLFYDPAADRPIQVESCRAVVWKAVREGQYVLLESLSNDGLTHHVVILDGGREEERVLFSMNLERIASAEIRIGETVSVLEIHPDSPVVSVLPSFAYIDFYDEQGRFLHGLLPETSVE